MAHTRKTLLLSNPGWDIMLDSGGRIVVSEGNYATAQNVANECRLFSQDAYFDQERGIPYFDIALGKTPAPSVLRGRLRKAAMLVDDVKEVTAITLDSFDTEKRILSGEIQFTSKEGENGTVGL